MSVGSGKRGIIGFLVIVIALAMVLSACGNGKGSNNAASSASAASGSPNSSGSASPSASENAPKRTITILTENAGSAYGRSVANWDENVYVQALNKIAPYNLDYEILDMNDFETQLSIRFASGDLPDLIEVSGIQASGVPAAIDAGALLEIGPLLEQYGQNILKNIPEEVWNNSRVKKDGKIYGIPKMTSQPASQVVYIRQDWLDKLNMKTPTTIEEFMAFFEAVKTQDINGNGDPNDEVPYTIRENMDFGFLFFGSYGVFPSNWSVVDGQLIPDMIRPEMKEPLKLYKEMYDKGYVPKNMFVNKAADNWANIVSDKVGVWLTSAGSYYAFIGEEFGDPNMKPAMIAAPAGPNGDKGLYPQSLGIQFAWVIPSDADNPEEMIKFLDWAWSDPIAHRYWNYGIEGYNYTLDGSEIVWDPANPNNMNENNIAHQMILSVSKDYSNSDEVYSLSEVGKAMVEGFKVAQSAAMPIPIDPGVIDAFQTNPELTPGFAAGTLFLDMFAKYITGNGDIDSAFDSFVADWKKRGGDKAIEQATAFYNSTK